MHTWEKNMPTPGGTRSCGVNTEAFILLGVILFVRLAKKGEMFQMNPRSLGILSQGKLGSAV